MGAGGLLALAMMTGCTTSSGSSRPQAGRASAVVSAEPTATAVGHTEVEQFDADIFRNYQNASGLIRHLQIGETVVAVCIVYDPDTAVTSTRGLWYRLSDNAYAAANTFWNQENPAPPDQDNAYDPRVPVCPDSPATQLPDVHLGRQ